MKEQEEFHHTDFPATELQYALLSATGLTGLTFIGLQKIIDIPYSWLPILGGITVIILTAIIAWIFKQISNRERIVLDQVGITMTRKCGKSKNYNWEQVSHLALEKENLFLESRIYLTDGSYFTSNVVRFPALQVERSSKLLSSIMDNDLEIVDYDALSNMQFGKAMESFAPQIMKQTKTLSEQESRKPKS